ncbi:hypothetical protein Rsub_11188 [Raphidocelis subcapitata]|uniref:START domain-containing protein n=1 Tax=Raphidocelis subcapitata TaxID=307507 RepID=A0A2V0PDB3_9CHLO|nr:hypothetical protein Rsub_11188 [Raphidocelis subcapitata]|eukprot:GBF97838.1 hypothetical protein Rsub_11188 [Raphidocelis subcapitata]
MGHETLPGALWRALAAVLLFPLALISGLYRLILRAFGAPAGADAGAPAGAPPPGRAARGAWAHPKSVPLLDLLAEDDEASSDAASAAAAGPPPRPRAGARLEWIGAGDLAWFERRLAPVEGRLLEGGRIGEGWQPLMDKHVPGEVRYVAYMRPLPNGTTEYLSITIAPDTTGAEMAEFFADDTERLKWDSMLHRTELVEAGRALAAEGEQIVLWHRKYPFAFLKDRWYAIARKILPPPPGAPLGAPHYGLSKVVPSPIAEAFAADEMPGVKRIDEFYSMWRCRTVPSPWPAPPGAAGPAPPACETVLLHHDNMKVPESLARVAIRTGMWKFLRSMVAATKPWAAARRARASPFEPDAAAACRRATGGADGRRAALSAVYGRAGTSAHELAPADEAEAAAAGAPAYHPHRHDAAALHAVATAPGDLQRLAAAAQEGPEAGPGARSEAGVRGGWGDDASSTASSGSSAAGLGGWMGWLPQGGRGPVAAKKAADAAAPEAPGTPPPRAPAPAPQRAAPASPLPPSEALVSAEVFLRPPTAPAAGGGSNAPSPLPRPLRQLPRVFSDPGLYHPGKTVEDATQTWGGPLRGAGTGAGAGRAGFAAPRHEGRGLLRGLAGSVAAGAAAGVAVLLLSRAAEGGGGGGAAAGEARRRRPAAAAAAAPPAGEESGSFLAQRAGGGAPARRGAPLRGHLLHVV